DQSLRYLNPAGQAPQLITSMFLSCHSLTNFWLLLSFLAYCSIGLTGSFPLPFLSLFPSADDCKKNHGSQL
ncbi:hypothetical protein, partial [Escherichia sp.]